MSRLASALLLALILTLVTVATRPALAAPGDPDSTFGTDGRVTVDFGGKTGAFRDAALQSDGKIVLVGYVFQPDAAGRHTDMIVVRLNADGSPDQEFGSAGMRQIGTTNGPTPGPDVANAVALQPDGKIVVGGYSYAGSVQESTVVRLTPSGSLDGSFSPGGTEGTGIARMRIGTANDIAVDPTGKIVTAGTWVRIGGTRTESFVERLTATGGGDDTFAAGGGSSFVFTFPSDTGDGINGMTLQPDGAIVTAGFRQVGDDDGAIARVLPGAGLDPGFGTGGRRAYIVSAGSSDQAEDVLVEADGKIAVAGHGGTGNDFTLTRLTAGGDIDPSLDGESTVTADFGGNDRAYAMALQASGKIIVVGTNEAGMGLARFQPGGVLDSTFGPGGKRTVTFPDGNSTAYALALQDDGKLVLAGSAGLKGAVVRLEGDSASSGGGPTSGPGGKGKVYRCGGRRATIVGTSKRNKLRGTRRVDVIVGLGGNDTISGLGRNDIVCGGSGNDKISGGNGNDKLFGDAGKDKVSGDGGNDRESGGSGNDKVSGGSGKDTLAGGSGKDSLAGGSGKDKLNGNAGKDKLNGGSGNDRCAGTDKQASC